MSKERDLFPWPEDGKYGLEVKLEDVGNIAHEVLYEDDVLKIKERPLYLGEALPRRRFDWAVAVLLVLLTALLGRAFWMQISSYGRYQQLAERNRLRSASLEAPRGIIRDRHGEILADNVPTFDLAATPFDLAATPEARLEILGRVARIVGLPISELEQNLSSARNPDQKIYLVRDIPYEQAIALRISLGDTPGIGVETGQKRRYLFSSAFPTFSHILGYIGKVSTDDFGTRDGPPYRPTDKIGKTGVEAWYEDMLRGLPGERVTEVDSFGNRQRVVNDHPPQPGKDLKLSIDADLQKKVEEILRKGIEEAKVSKGSAVVMDPRNGELLAIASWPAYDDNIFSGQVSSTAYQAYLNDPNNPFLARAWAGLYPAGSTIKPTYAIALLAEHIITPRTTVLSVGGIRIGAQFFPDWSTGGHGITDVRRAIAWSVNTFFYITCGGYEGFKGLGADKMAEWLRRFGFGSRLGLDIPGEQAGLVPDPDWKMAKRNEKWYVGDTYNLAIGQGDLLVTPLQIASATAQIANGGKHVIPHVAFDAPWATSTVDRSMLEAVDTVRSGMRDTVVYGSGRVLANLPFSVAGKTGTAQWRTDRPNHAWFTAFAPYEHPAVVVTILLEEGVEGSSTAVPVAKDILTAWYGLKNQTANTD